MERTAEMSPEELGLNLNTAILAVSYSANYVSTLNFSFLIFEKDKIVTIILTKYVMYFFYMFYTYLLI